MTPSPSVLETHADRLRQQTLLELLAQRDRPPLYLQAAGLRIDASRHRVDAPALAALQALAAECGFAARRDALFSGAIVNPTERRAALHTLLRAEAAPTPTLAPLYDDVLQARRTLLEWADRLGRGQWQLPGGEAATDLVNLGIGGSDLGPAFVTEALAHEHNGRIRTHFVANVDAEQLLAVLSRVNPRRTLFVMTSKTFTTQETLLNAATARRWLIEHGVPEAHLPAHFLAVTAQPARARDWGVPDTQILPFWEWVGGRFSLWSAVGLPIAAATSPGVFSALLAGGRAMDEHFLHAAPGENAPLLLALLDYWYGRCWQAHSQVILPYHHRLRRLPDFLQQLMMESTGKRVHLDGSPVTGNTGPVVWGSEGTNGQHSFHQLLHQGTGFIPADFILPLCGGHDLEQHQSLLVAHCLAQARVLMTGRSAEDIVRELQTQGHTPESAAALAPHMAMPGGRPSTLITMDRLTPENLGALIALYEHRVFAQSVLWDINPFDQWGVELGKRIANDIQPCLTGEATTSFDPATDASIALYRQAVARHST